MLTKHKQAGMTLIELMIGVAIVAILLVMGVRSYSGWVQNQRVRVAAEAILNGIQITRTEAIRRNAPVQFHLTGSRAGWAVQTIVTAEPVQARSGAEDPVDVLVSSVLPSGATSLSFNGLGRIMTLNPLDLTAPLARVNVSSVNSDRPLSITVSSAGNVRMCDPNSAAGDPRECH